MKHPCSECPWRRKSAPGWLGSQFTPEEWVELAKSDHIIPCHKEMERSDAQCVGAAMFRANICKVPRDRNAIDSEPNKVTVFANGNEFVEHHRKYGLVSSELQTNG